MRCALICGLLCVSFGCSAEQPKTLQTSVCEIRRRPSFFLHKNVAVKAKYESDGTHASLLTDSHCKNVGISILFYPSEDSSLAILKSFLKRGRPGTVDKEIHGTFVGRMTAGTGAGGISGVQFRLISATDLTIQPKKF